MKKRLIKLTILLISFALLVHFSGVLNTLFKPSNVIALGDLVIDFGVPEGDPIFVVENMLPGDTEEREIDVTNGGTISRLVAVKGVRTGGTPGLPVFEEILDIVIEDNGTPIYGAGSPTGPKTLQQFFTDSAVELPLSVVNPNDTSTYKFIVYFPHSAGNEYQLRSVIFDLIFGIVRGENIVINEVYYNVDDEHGLDCPLDRGVLGVSGNNVTIKNNGAGSTNIVTIKKTDACKILQKNITGVNTNVNSSSNTGGNVVVSNVSSFINSIITGNATTNINVSVNGSSNVNTLSCNTLLTGNDEWFELFNPTDHDINLKNWTFTDNSGTVVKINANRIIKAGGFALVAKDNSVWNNWTENPLALKIPLGAQIGNGLENAGDRIIMKDAGGIEVDRMSWGTDTTGFTPNATNPVVPEGSSTERLTPGFDNDVASDWEERTPPTPGN